MKSWDFKTQIKCCPLQISSEVTTLYNKCLYRILCYHLSRRIFVLTYNIEVISENKIFTVKHFQAVCYQIKCCSCCCVIKWCVNCVYGSNWHVLQIWEHVKYLSYIILHLHLNVVNKALANVQYQINFKSTCDHILTAFYLTCLQGFKAHSLNSDE